MDRLIKEAERTVEELKQKMKQSLFLSAEIEAVIDDFIKEIEQAKERWKKQLLPDSSESDHSTGK